MNRDDAIKYAKILVRKIVELFDNDDDFAYMFSGEPINNKKQFDQIVDAYAEWCFPDDDREEKQTDE